MFADAITLIALGPLTNIATCLKLDADFGKKLKDCFIMGGNYQGNFFLSVTESSFEELNSFKNK